MSRTLEITVMSGEDLRLHQRPIKKSFAIVKIDSQNSATTRIDDQGENNPYWNQRMVLNLPMNVTFLTVDVHSGTSSGNRIVGTAKIPVTDFIGGYVPENYLHFLSYRLRDVRGGRNGIVNISVRVKVADDDIASTSKTGMKVQAPTKKADFVDGKGGGDGGVAIGIPIWSGVCSDKF